MSDGDHSATLQGMCGSAPESLTLPPAACTLVVCRRLSLSTNQIDRLVPLAGMEKLRILSVGRNQIKKFEGLAVSTHMCCVRRCRGLAAVTAWAQPRTPARRVWRCLQQHETNRDHIQFVS